jgi:2-deoxy-D-gluconate 3-dehydrogenase
MRLDGKTAVVTGGGQGIGAAVVRALADAGASVVVSGRTLSKLEQISEELRAEGRNVWAAGCDVSDPASILRLAAVAKEKLGPVDILVNNAGIAHLSGGILQETAESWDAVIEAQLNAVFLLSKLAAASMATRKHGKIINLGSMYSYFGAGPIPSYSAAKGAIVQLTKSMAIELAPHGIQVNAIAPGWIATDMTAPVRTPEFRAMNDEIIARTPAGRWGRPDEMAGAATFLASSAADFVTGETIRVDGGYAIR